jgi:protein subunit release factor B
MLRITDRIAIHEYELEEHFVRASGPGGQNVNKLATCRMTCARGSSRSPAGG